MHLSNIAVVFAGGVGSRMRYANGPKQFMEVKDKPILIYTLEIFENHHEIDAIYLVITKSHLSTTKKLVKKFKISKVRATVPGGDSAHASIICGLEAARQDGAKDDDIVLVHDGVRPILDTETINRNIKMTKKHGNAVTSIAAYETPARSIDGVKVDNVLKRSEMYTLQAPQTFRFGNAYRLNQQAIKDGLVGSVVDQAELNRHYGEPIYLIPGLRGNAKITVPLDFTYFEFLVESGKYKQIIKGKVI
jgi:2-C-methyl-D-erythritol 4-phosphate cytidylyltransferase